MKREYVVQKIMNRLKIQQEDSEFISWNELGNLLQECVRRKIEELNECP